MEMEKKRNKTKPIGVCVCLRHVNWLLTSNTSFNVKAFQVDSKQCPNMPSEA